MGVLGSGSGQISVGAVTFKPEAFVPPMPTTTTKFVPPAATSTATSTVTSIVTSTTTSSRLQTGFQLTRTTPGSEVDVTTTEAVSTSMSTGTGAGMMQTTGDPSGPAWWLFVVSGVAVGAAAAVVMLLFQRARKGADELALDV